MHLGTQELIDKEHEGIEPQDIRDSWLLKSTKLDEMERTLSQMDALEIAVTNLFLLKP